MTDELLIRREGGVLILTLNRPAARNAFDLALGRRLLAALAAAAADDTVSVVVLTGAGAVFCPGADLKELARLAEAGDAALAEAANERIALFQALHDLPKTVIASLNGPAIGGGAGLAMACDLVIAAEDAFLSWPEMKGGVVPGVILVSLARLLGPRQAKDLILSGRRLPAAEARELGLVNRVVPAAALAAETLAWSRSFETSHLQALQHTKSLFHRIGELDDAAAYALARDVNIRTRPAGGLR